MVALHLGSTAGQERLRQAEPGGPGGLGAAEGHRGHGANAEGGRQHQQIAERRGEISQVDGGRWRVLDLLSHWGKHL